MSTARHFLAWVAVAVAGCGAETAGPVCPIDTIPCDQGCCPICRDDLDCDSPARCCNNVCSTSCEPCVTNETRCAQDGQCHDLANDFSHCGECGNSCAEHGATIDACAGGSCICVGRGSACDAGETCSASGCVPVPCDAGTCGSGCCDGTTCRAPVLGSCGLGGAACVDCVAEWGLRVDSCSAGVCVCASTGAPCASDARCESTGCVPITYSWQTDADWSTCDAPCGGGTQARDVWCEADDGTRVADLFCTGTRPDATRDCNADPCPTYSWETSNWSSCTVSCGGGTQTRIVWCERDDGTQVDDSFCDAGTRPSTSRSCNTQACTAACTATSGWMSNTAAAECNAGQDCPNGFLLTTDRTSASACTSWCESRAITYWGAAVCQWWEGTRCALINTGGTVGWATVSAQTMNCQ